jgi:hypothetical protein
MAGLEWVKGALALETPTAGVTPEELKLVLDELRPDVAHADKVELMADASVNDLNGRGLSATAKAVYGRTFDFLVASAKELAARERAATVHAIAYHEGEVETDVSVSLKADFKKALKELKSRAELDDAALLERWGVRRLPRCLARRARPTRMRRPRNC